MRGDRKHVPLRTSGKVLTSLKSLIKYHSLLSEWCQTGLCSKTWCEQRSVMVQGLDSVGWFCLRRIGWAVMWHPHTTCFKQQVEFTGMCSEMFLERRKLSTCNYDFTDNLHYMYKCDFLFVMLILQQRHKMRKKTGIPAILSPVVCGSRMIQQVLCDLCGQIIINDVQRFR